MSFIFFFPCVNTQNKHRYKQKISSDYALLRCICLAWTQKAFYFLYLFWQTERSLLLILLQNSATHSHRLKVSVCFKTKCLLDGWTVFENSHTWEKCMCVCGDFCNFPKRTIWKVSQCHTLISHVCEIDKLEWFIWGINTSFGASYWLTAIQKSSSAWVGEKLGITFYSRHPFLGH